MNELGNTVAEKEELNTALVQSYIERVETALQRNLKSIKHNPRTQEEIDTVLRELVPPVL